MTIRWVLYDPILDVSATVPINPDSMTSIELKKTFRYAQGTVRDRRARTFETPPAQQPWEFSGVIRTKAHYDLLLAWSKKENAIHVTDHLGRTLRVYISDFQPTDRNPTPHVTWRARYTMKCTLLGRES